MPAVTLTDHGSLAGAVELHREARKQGIKPIVGCELYVADDRHRQEKGYAHLTVLAESNEGYANLIRLSSLGYLEGYYYKPRVDWELLERHAQGLVVLSGCLSGRVCKALEESRPQDAAADLDRLVQIFGRDSTYVEIQNAGLEPQQRINPQLARIGGGDRDTARRHRGRPLPAPRGRARTRGPALHPVGRLAEEPEPLAVRHRPVLLQVAGGDGGRLRRLPAGAPPDPRGRRAVHGDDRHRPAAPAEIPDPGGAGRVRVPGRAVRDRPRPPLRVGHPRAARASPVRAEDDPGDGLRRLLPDRLGLRPLREDARDPGRAGPRLRRGLAGRLLPGDHRRRPDAVRPAVRAFPQPRPQVDAGHGHRLRGRRPRAGDQLRRREVRPRPRRPDHHVLDDDGPRGRSRRRPRAGDPLRLRRQGREADPGGAEGLPRRVPEAGAGAEGRVRRRSARPGDRRPGEAARGSRPGRLDPRRRRRDRRPAADRVRAAAAEGRRPGGGHAVPDGRRREAGAAEDGLPRAPEPRRDRRGRQAHRRPRHRDDPARRRANVRDAPSRRRDRRLPVRVVRHARGAPAGQADRVRGPDRARRALPPRPDAVHPGVCAPKARCGADRVRGRAPAPDHGADARHRDLPGAVDGDRQADRRFHARGGGRSPEGDRQEDPLADGLPEGEVHRGLHRERNHPAGRPPALGRHGEGPGLLLQQVARCRLRADRLSNGLAEGAPPAASTWPR